MGWSAQFQWLGRALRMSAALVATGTLLLSAQQRKDLAETGPVPEVRLEPHEGKTQFHLGDLIELDLVFRNSTPEQYSVNTAGYHDLVDQVEITPARGWVQWQGQSGHDYLSDEPLNGEEIRISVVLNEGFVFREAGHYEVRLTTRRLLRGSGNSIRGYGPVTTNALGIDLQQMPEDVEAAMVRNLMAQIATADMRTRAGRETHQEAIARLAALQGDDALRAKLSLILAQDDDMRGVTREALAATRNLPLQLSLLEAAWNDPQRPPIYDMPVALQETRALLREQMLQGWNMSVGGSRADESEAARLAAKEHAADMEALIDSLPKRSGQSRTDAAYYLMEDRSLSPAQIAAVKPVALEEFSRMNQTEQRMLLETAWPAIRDVSLKTDLTIMLDQFPTDRDALRRLIELNPQDAKAYVVRAVCEAKSAVPFDSVAALPDATLPEVDGCLGQLLRVVPTGPSETHNWKIRALLAARFASPAILPLVCQGWKNPEQDGPVLALLLRYAPEGAVSKIQQASSGTRMNMFFDINKVFNARRAVFPEEFRDWLRQRVKHGPYEDAGFAGYELSKGGAREDRTLLEERLARMRSEWSARTDEVASASPGSAAYEARKLDLELMSALRTSTVWSVNDEDAAQLARGCMSDQCKLYGEVRKEARQNQAN